ncbi:Uncharacterised protein [Mycobacteroides abscessus subsp. massiliense]|nr:Uncharacterised protein [Mycobacteroides abscessus subsp. massiliense]SKM99325.1 Uncharacterised protein [Mycobacteroides abscessus subsp. massiliense]SKN77919.1 Uncharacterised protein [Mycobacteroides abscessus subsp. massiliense]SKN95330.1 Uncharacterised protein [Mycobacteroides abscessus subsp. massiliense]SKO23113.1 Uncharacterised protein [Mycobacteroides abscessus subsp. massiliense]
MKLLLRGLGWTAWVLGLIAGGYWVYVAGGR